jgi:DNA polymerase
MVGRGSPTAKIVLIGEAPGQHEDLEGKPFVGKSGQWLQIQLDTLDLSRKVYITNAVKCRPAQNRKPREKEIVACRKYLRDELRILAPRCVVTLGKTARSAMEWDHINWNDRWYGTNMMGSFYYSCTFHPAYGLREGDHIQQQIIATLEWAKLWTK